MEPAVGVLLEDLLGRVAGGQRRREGGSGQSAWTGAGDALAFGQVDAAMNTSRQMTLE
jgi:hypothetical protein